MDVWRNFRVIFIGNMPELDASERVLVKENLFCGAKFNRRIIALDVIKWSWREIY